jgi:hypothetical protein
MTENTNVNTSKPSVGIRPWGTPQKQQRRFDDEDLPRLNYMKLLPGLNTVRAVSDMGVYYQARVKLPNSKSSFGDRIRTSYPTYDDCPIIEFFGMEGKERYYVVVIDRADPTELKLLDMGQLVQEQIDNNLEVINSMRKSGDKVNPRDFDISIKFNPKSKKPAGYHSVVCGQVDPMSAEDLKLISDIGGEEVIIKIINRQLICPKRETVIKNLKKLGWDGSVVPKEEKKAKGAKLEEATEDDYSFQAPSTSETETDEAVNA